MAYIMQMRKGEIHTAPINGTPLSDFTEGQVILINENGTPQEFYIAKHDYESEINGAGKVLLVRKSLHSSRQWNSSSSNTYASSAVDTWLNGDYKALFSSDIQNLMGTTKLYNIAGRASTTKSVIERSVFLLSITELNLTYNNTVAAGTALSIANTLKVAYSGNTKQIWWTRTPITSGSYANNSACSISTSGSVSRTTVTTSRYIRPCFTLPSNALATINEDGSVSLNIT